LSLYWPGPGTILSSFIFCILRRILSLLKLLVWFVFLGILLSGWYWPGPGTWFFLRFLNRSTLVMKLLDLEMGCVLILSNYCSLAYEPGPGLGAVRISNRWEDTFDIPTLLFSTFTFYDPGPTGCNCWSLNLSSVDPKNCYLNGLCCLLIA